MSVEPWLWRRTSSQNGEPVAPPSARAEGDRADDHPANLAPSAQDAVLDEMCCSGARDLTNDNGRTAREDANMRSLGCRGTRPCRLRQ